MVFGSQLVLHSNPATTFTWDGQGSVLSETALLLAISDTFSVLELTKEEGGQVGGGGGGTTENGACVCSSL